jgi:hypothetical protein
MNLLNPETTRIRWNRLIVTRLSRLPPLELMFLISLYPALAQTNPAQLSKAVQEIGLLDNMRSGLVSMLKDRADKPTMQTMKEVGAPVGMRTMALNEIRDYLTITSPAVFQPAKLGGNP